MSTVWILVCDSAKARFFEVRPEQSTWHLLLERAHEESRSKAALLEGDRSGSRPSEGASVHHNALAPASSPKEVEKRRFARELGRVLDEASRASSFQRWVLVAPPHFMGILEHELTPELVKRLQSKVAKNMTRLGEPELRARLHETVRVPVSSRKATRESQKDTH
jgi:protein required for attachment to host cells